MPKRYRLKKTTKCPEPFNTLIDIAGAAAMRAFAKHKVKKDYARGEGEESAIAAAAVFGAGSFRRGSAGIINLGGLMGLNSAIKDINKAGTISPVTAEAPFVDHVSGAQQHTAQKFSHKYTWRQHCEDGVPYGVSPQDYETADEYDAALQVVKEGDPRKEPEVEASQVPTQKESAKTVSPVWHKYCTDGTPYGLDPRDFSCADDYEEAIEAAKKAK